MNNVETVESKLKFYQIDITRYDDEMRMLQELSFTELQAKNLILRPKSNFAVSKTIELTPVLLEAPYHLSHEDIFKLAMNSSIANFKLTTFIKFYQSLLDLSITREQIIQIFYLAKHTKVIGTLIKHLNYLIEQQFTIDQIFKVMSKPNSSVNLESIAKICKILLFANIDHEAIIELVPISGGSSTLKSIAESIDKLIEANFEVNQIIRMIERITHPRNIISVAGIYQFLKNHGFTPAQFFAIVDFSGMKCLNAIKYSYSESIALEISPELMVSLVLRYGNTVEFYPLFELFSQLKFFYTHEQIVHMALKEDGITLIRNAIKHILRVIQHQRLTAADIVRIVSRSDGLNIKRNIFNTSSLETVADNQLHSVFKEFEELEELELATAHHSNSSEEMYQQKNPAIKPALSISPTILEEDISTDEKLWATILKDLEKSQSSNSTQAAEMGEDWLAAFSEEAHHSNSSIQSQSVFSFSGEKRKLDEISHSAPGAKK